MKAKLPNRTLLAAALGLGLAAMTTTFQVNAADCPADAICRNDEAPGNYTRNGPYRVADFNMSRFDAAGGATVYYPTNAEPPFASLVFCPPFIGSQYMYQAWGPFFASHGIVMVTMDSETILDTVDQRAGQQREVLDELKAENSDRNSPLYGKLDTSRMGVTGWSMGGGATWINSAEYPGLKTAMSLAGHNLSAIDFDSKGRNTQIPTLIMNGVTDLTYLGGLGQSSGVFRNIPRGVPKVIYEVATAGHFAWGTPTAASDNVAELALAFQKTFLEGDLRWAQYIDRPRSNVATWDSENIPQ
ncbi:hypothetical protein FT643_05455 [Ketobacter sp. MCCC 1A13808]|uniref:dienelactone hydrolase family protein n=1 Tax=Ketobacter sp. MCCC 1A13808 TaxID=2602738 RepID=UPI0012EB113D|nr:hypothetical protein [Ketobacter sp. MCCC 1A13808]MVF11587.1 hypothetical protein [Ketobacter sp. MCCC 1A13808]